MKATHENLAKAVGRSRRSIIYLCTGTAAASLPGSERHQSARLGGTSRSATRSGHTRRLETNCHSTRQVTSPRLGADGNSAVCHELVFSGPDDNLANALFQRGIPIQQVERGLSIAHLFVEEWLFIPFPNSYEVEPMGQTVCVCWKKTPVAGSCRTASCGTIMVKEGQTRACRPGGGKNSRQHLIHTARPPWALRALPDGRGCSRPRARRLLAESSQLQRSVGPTA